MSEIYVISDDHFGHENIIKYTGRPYENYQHMDVELIKNHNSVVKDGDVVYHIGDFNMSGGKNSPLKIKDYERQLNGTIVHIKGNHDKSNKMKSILEIALCKFGGYTFLMQHVPPLMDAEIPEDCDFVLCGHMHQKWKVNMDLRVPIINMSVENWNYTPVKLNDVIRFYEKLVGENK